MERVPGREGEGKKLVLESLSFVSVFQTIMELARRGGVDTSNPALLRAVTHVKTWEALDQLLRDPKHLHKLTPHVSDLTRAARSVSARSAMRPGREFVFASQLSSVRGAVPEGSGLDWLAGRQATSGLIYSMARRMQERKENEVPEMALTRQRRTHEFLMKLHGHGLDNPDPELQEEIARYETLLGVLYCLRVVTVLSQREFDLVKLARHGLKKYGVKNVDGINVCYWCGNPACVCGGRKDVMKAQLPEITSGLVQTHGLPEMDAHMAVYGVGRNSAIDALAGPIRSFSEFGEYEFLQIMSELGLTVDGLQKKLGSLALEGTRYVRGARKNEAAGSDTEEELYAEAADAIVSWPALATQAFGLNFTRSVMRGVEHMAKGAHVELVVVPQDMRQTVPSTR